MGYFTLLNLLFKMKIANIQIYLTFFVVGIFYRNDFWAKIKLENWFNILDLSLNSYIGIFFIVIGLIVRVDLKFSIQKDLK